MKLIQTVTVGAGGSASIEFTSIPATYTDLLLKVSLRSTSTSDYITMEFNNSTSSFSSKYLAGYGGAGVSQGSRSDNAQSGTTNDSSWTASTFSNFDLYVPNYTGSTNKSFTINTVTENNGTTAVMQIVAGLWSNTAAITQVKLIGGATNLAQYSSASLYGILKGSGGADAA